MDQKGDQMGCAESVLVLVGSPCSSSKSILENFSVFTSDYALKGQENALWGHRCPKEM